MGWKVGGRFKREATYVYLRLIHVDVWQKPTQYCKAIILPLKINKKQLTEKEVIIRVWGKLDEGSEKYKIPVVR